MILPRPRSAGSSLWLLAVLAAALPVPGAAQAGPRSGLVEAALRLRQMDGVKRVLMIGAHPDDEDSALLAALARGHGVETAYLSLTRGDGGQNLIGPELSAGLGIVRTGELLAARSIDGGRQFFTRALDYGFSKSADEALSHWRREELLRDMVWVIRTFRPQVIVSVFSGTAADGHGHHQVAGLLAPEAMAAAADPARFPEQLAEVGPWQATKLFRRSRNDPPGTPTTMVETGVFDPVLGRSWYQIAMDGRSQHRSQDMGAAQPAGPRASTLVLVRSSAGGAGEPLFAGVDTTLAGLVSDLPVAARPGALARVRAYRAAVREAEASLGVADPGRSALPLASALESLRTLAESAPRHSELARAVEHRRQLAAEALLAAAGVVVEASAADALVAPGEETQVTVRVWNGGRFAISAVRPEVELPVGWTAEPAPPSERGPVAADSVAARGRIEPGELAAWTFGVRVPADAEASNPYFMRLPPSGDMFTWPDEPALWGLPADPPLVTAGARLALVVAPGQPPVQLVSHAEAPYVGVDQAFGEFREPLLVVPAVSVALDQPAMPWPLADRAPREIAVRLRGYSRAGVRGTVRIEAPAGWTVEPASAPFGIEGRGAVNSVTFRVRPPDDDAGGRAVLRAVAEGPGGPWTRTVQLIDYPHIRRFSWLVPAELAISRVPVVVAAGLDVGYVMGTGDGGYEALRQMGVNAELLTPEQVRGGAFARFDAIVIGVRAYETRPDLVAANARLLDFARAGGTVIVQYQQYQYPNGGFAPYPLTIRNPHDRVTDETAPVRVLDPANPLLATPNRITEEDFAGWKQERGLYFLGSWDDRYQPLLEMNDPGEPPQRGALVVAPLGEGLYVYTALAFFRQFPAAVPGAYRLFANLVSLNARSWAGRPTQDGAGRAR